MLGDEPMDAATLASLPGDAASLREKVERERRTGAVDFDTIRAGLHFGLGDIWIDEGKAALERDRARGEDLVRRGVAEVELAAATIRFAPFLRRLAQGYALLGRTTDAEATYRAAIALAPDDFSSHYDLAGILYGSQRYAEALAEMQAIRPSLQHLDPSEVADYHFGMGLVLARSQPGKARYHFERVLEANPDHPRKAQIQQFIGRFIQAGVSAEADD
jgi:tetratricopeptide (TPR) repeat protein